MSLPQSYGRCLSSSSSTQPLLPRPHCSPLSSSTRQWSVACCVCPLLYSSTASSARLSWPKARTGTPHSHTLLLCTAVTTHPRTHTCIPTHTTLQPLTPRHHSHHHQQWLRAATITPFTLPCEHPGRLATAAGGAPVGTRHVLIAAQAVVRREARLSDTHTTSDQHIFE